MKDTPNDVRIRQLLYCSHLYEKKLMELMGDKFNKFSIECVNKLMSKKAHNYIYGISDDMPD